MNQKQPSSSFFVLRQLFVYCMFLTSVMFCFSLPTASAHGISEESRVAMTEGGLVEYIWLGAEHMLTGYDHLLFLFGVLFFLTGFRDVVRFITAFTLGHCITLLGATLAGVTANAYLVDAVIALSVIYKGFENLNGFEKFFSIRAPNLLAMVFVFGLIHGFGLSTRLQELSLGNEGMISRILAFNVGVELGQIVALAAMLGVFAAWRSSKFFEGFGTWANIALVCAGVVLFAFQVNGYVCEAQHEKLDDHHHDHDHGSELGHDHDTPHGEHTHEHEREHKGETQQHSHKDENREAHGHEAHGHEAHGHKTHGHEAHGHEAHGHKAHGHEAHGHEVDEGKQKTHHEHEHGKSRE